jgi:glyoxylase-like metal-dependent hydrolase (beta-lactamase superfamily II)
MDEIAARKIYMIDTVALGFRRIVACYLIMDERTALIDTGYASSLSEIISELVSHNVRLDYIIPTHVHLDHCGGAAGLARHFPSAKVMAHSSAVKHLINPERLVESVKLVYGPDILNVFGNVEPIPEERVQAVSDGEVLRLGGSELTFLYTPGHAPHQISIHESESNMVLTADAVPAQYPDFRAIIPTTPPPSFDPQQYEESMRRLGRLNARQFLTPHYGPTEATMERVEKLILRTRNWISILSQAGGDEIGHTMETLRRGLEEEAGKPLPQYAENLLRISVMGILKYLGKRQLF